jgi:hypothetical protein
MHEHVAIVGHEAVAALRGRTKRIETRFYRRRRAPVGSIHAGDRIHFKITGGPIIGTSGVVAVREFADLSPASLRRLRALYGTSVRASARYWAARARCRYGVLIWLGSLHAPASAIRIPRQYGTAWIVLRRR